MLRSPSSVVAISIILLVACARLDTTDPDVGWTITPIAIWAGTEINLSVVTSCLPSLRPIYLLLTKGSANPDSVRTPRQYNNGSVLRNKALVTFGSKGRSATKSFAGNELEDDTHPFTIIHEDEDNVDSSKRDIALEELQPPRDRVMVRDDIVVRYSSV